MQGAKSEGQALASALPGSLYSANSMKTSLTGLLSPDDNVDLILPTAKEIAWQRHWPLKTFWNSAKSRRSVSPSASKSAKRQPGPAL